MMVIVRTLFLGGILVSLWGCTSVPGGLSPVTGFDADRYMGTWHEIARLDHSFERGLTRVTAEYALRSDGSLSVVNRGFDAAKGRWKEARGRAKFAGDAGTGSLQVSFFGPFYGGYHIIALDREAYRWAVVCGPSRSYLWILAREKRLEPELLADLVGQARGWGFETEKLVYVEQD